MPTGDLEKFSGDCSGCQRERHFRHLFELRHGAEIDFKGEYLQALRRKHHHCERRMFPLRGDAAPAEFHWQRSQRNPQRFFQEHYEMQGIGEHTATVNIVVSLGTTLAQAEEECWIASGLLTVTLLRIRFPCQRTVAHT